MHLKKATVALLKTLLCSSPLLSYAAPLGAFEVSLHLVSGTSSISWSLGRLSIHSNRLHGRSGVTGDLDSLAEIIALRGRRAFHKDRVVFPKETDTAGMRC